MKKKERVLIQRALKDYSGQKFSLINFGSNKLPEGYLVVRSSKRWFAWINDRGTVSGHLDAWSAYKAAWMDCNKQQYANEVGKNGC